MTSLTELNLPYIAVKRYHRCMTIIQDWAQPIDTPSTEAYAHLFHTLGDPTRLAIVEHLASGEHRVRDLREHMGLAQSTVSKHVSYLAECGLLTARTEGRSTWYSLADADLLRSLISATEKILEATGKPARLGPHLHPINEFGAEVESGVPDSASTIGTTTRRTESARTYGRR